MPEEPNPILTLLVGLDDGFVQTYFGIKHEGKLWLVTRWLIAPDSVEATPERMIRVDSLQPPPMECQAGERFHYANVLLPRSVIEGASQEAPGFEVRSLPDSQRVHRRHLYLLPTIFGS